MGIKPEDLENNSLLRELLINYCSLNYEENADFSYHSLAMEYNYLLRSGELNELIAAAAHTIFVEAGLV